MAWHCRFGDGKEGRGLELSLGLPGYFSGSPTQAAGLEDKGRGGASAAAGAKGSRGLKARSATAGPVVGWPPVRAFRRNLASSSSSKPSHGAASGHNHHDAPEAAGAKAEAGKKKGKFVKVNMDGVPIGRKVDLAAHGGYATLSNAVDQLFRGLLAAGQTSGGEQAGSGDYTLVYEDDEGDQMLLGDVPWDMFVATAKRLRVLGSSDLSPSSLRAVRRQRTTAGC